MKPEDIKIGETYTVRVKIRKIGETYIDCSPILEGGVLSNHWPTAFAVGELSAFSPIPTENGRNNSEPAPKYDPNRLFRKGDKVRVVAWNGRNYYDIDHNTKLETGSLAEISDDEEAEQQEGYVSVIFQGYIRFVPPCYLKLVTPVEELEPYSVREYVEFYAVEKDGAMFSTFFKGSYYEKTQAAAEAECARLNAEFRKEQSHE